MPSKRHRRASSRKHAKDWGEGHPHKAAIAMSLSEGSIEAEVGITVDSILISSIFGPQQPKTEGRLHNISSLAVDGSLSVDNNLRRCIYERFEAMKSQIIFSSTPEAYLESARRLASELHEKQAIFQQLGIGARTALNW